MHLAYEKMKDEDEFDALTLNLVEAATDRGKSLAIIAGREATASVEKRGREQDALDALKTFGPNDAAYTELRGAFCAATETKKPTFDRALMGLKRQCAVRNENGRYTIPFRTRAHGSVHISSLALYHFCIMRLTNRRMWQREQSDGAS